LGPELALPPLRALPAPLALMGAAQLAVADGMLPAGNVAIGIGQRAYRGRALVVEDPLVALESMEPGDIVVTTATSPSWNVVLASAAGLVTTTGGVLSHAAVLARELGLPAVIGDPTAVRRLHTGMVVDLDPATATVTPATA
ncbi:MAG: pyruvate, phosphate dikinase, partial [Acidimicrobiia bacterium]|nr:pyruvate, phosphate dikinase [Acidimicrobiia bacterium]